MLRPCRSQTACSCNFPSEGVKWSNIQSLRAELHRRHNEDGAIKHPVQQMLGEDNHSPLQSPLKPLSNPPSPRPLLCSLAFVFGYVRGQSYGSGRLPPSEAVPRLTMLLNKERERLLPSAQMLFVPWQMCPSLCFFSTALLHEPPMFGFASNIWTCQGGKLSKWDVSKVTLNLQMISLCSSQRIWIHSTSMVQVRGVPVREGETD